MSKTMQDSGKLLVADTEVMGMPIKQYKLDGAIAQVGEGADEKGKWATVYFVMSRNPGKGEAQAILKSLKSVYKDWRFGITVSLNPTMKHITKKLGITEYDEEYMRKETTTPSI